MFIDLELIAMSRAFRVLNNTLQATATITAHYTVSRSNLRFATRLMKTETPELKSEIELLRMLGK